MARILFTAWPFAGCVHPQIAVARCLTQRGHTVAFYTGSTFAPLLQREGFTFIPFQPALESAVGHYVLSSDAMGRNWRRPWRLRPQIRGLFLDTVPLQTQDIESARRSWEPDAIVTDPAMWGPFLLVADLHKMPVAILSYACGCMLPGPGAPPMGLGLPLPRTGFTRLSNWLSGMAMNMFLSDTRKRASALREQFGLDAVDGPIIGLARDHLYLVPSSPEFDYERNDLPPTVQYVGPLQWYPSNSRPSWLDDLPSDRPVVYVTEGTLHVRDSFLLRAAAEGLADLPVYVILGTVGDRNAEDFVRGGLPANVRLVQWVNHSELLPRTAAMLTTAGGGTVMAGMQHGVPLVVVPTEWDKAENAQRVVEAGAGIRLTPRQCRPARLRSAVQQILSDQRYQLNARRIAMSLARRGGPERAAALIEKMARSAIQLDDNEESYAGSHELHRAAARNA